MLYETEFEEAQKRTYTWGLDYRDIASVSNRYLSPVSLTKVSACAQTVLGHMPAEGIAAQCFAVSTFLREPLEETLGVPLTYTIGYVNLGKGVVFHTPVEDLKRMLDAGFPTSQALNLHAWLTLPSYEIIDLTLATTYGLVNNVPKLIGSAAFIHPEDMVGGQSYHPQVLGEDYMRRIGVMIELEGFVLG